jgi:hypothetical protein
MRSEVQVYLKRRLKKAANGLPFSFEIISEYFLHNHPFFIHVGSMFCEPICFRFITKFPKIQRLIETGIQVPGKPPSKYADELTYLPGNAIIFT